VDGGSPCRDERHWRDWDPAGAQPEIRWRHVAILV
jgi:hypothetical protein